jgi:predicted PurR-regulated permease PerM
VLIGIGLWLLDVPLAFADGGWQLALAVLGLVIGVQFTEGTLLQPVIQSRRVDLHPAVILLAVAAGGSLFGIPGAYLAVPVTAVASAVYASLTADEP